jgi:hypothetical protein
MPTLNLKRRSIFMAASFPSGERGDAVRPFDPLAIADAVSALTRATFVAGGRLVFGGHPTISPLVLLIAGELNQSDVVDIYQSRWFSASISVETMRMVGMGYGRIRWTDRKESLEASLREMRVRMFQETDPIGGVFIGGMSGLYEEFELFHEYLPHRPRVPLAGPGGAASSLAADPHNIEAAMRRYAFSPQYPAACRALLTWMDGRDALE